VISIHVPAMSSRQDVRAISARICDVPGVQTLHADLATRTVEVTGCTDPAAVGAAIRAAGYAADPWVDGSSPAAPARPGGPSVDTFFATDATGLPEATAARVVELVAEREQLDAWLAAPPNKILAAVAEMDDPAADRPGSVSYSCPMHPEVVSDRPGRCPTCGMKLMATALPDDHRDHDRMQHDHADHATGGSADGIEWDDDMVELNRRTTPATLRWKLLDRTAGGDSPPTHWLFTVGERVKIRLVNEMDSDHPMHTRSTSTAPDASSCCPATACRSRTSCGRTPC
jgi:copper chaperone CopZ